MRTRDAMLIAALTGMRIEEIVCLKVKDWNTKAKTLYVAGTKTQAAKRTIPAHSALTELLTVRMKARDRMTSCSTM
jgi:integrase